MDDHERLLKIAALNTAISLLREQKRQIEASLAKAITELTNLKLGGRREPTDPDTQQYDAIVRRLFPNPNDRSAEN